MSGGLLATLMQRFEIITHYLITTAIQHVKYKYLR